MYLMHSVIAVSEFLKPFTFSYSSSIIYIRRICRQMQGQYFLTVKFEYQK